jgi:hypothetical protein
MQANPENPVSNQSKRKSAQSDFGTQEPRKIKIEVRRTVKSRNRGAIARRFAAARSRCRARKFQA